MIKRDATCAALGRSVEAPLLDTHIPLALPALPPLSYGYDPLGLGQDEANLAKYQANELLHARWAMLAAAGIIIPEGLQSNGADLVGATWFETGAAMLDGGTLNYFAVPWGIINNPLPLVLITLIEVGLMGAVEKFRSDGTGPKGYSPGEQQQGQHRRHNLGGALCVCMCARACIRACVCLSGSNSQ